MFKNILKIAGLVLLISLFFSCEEDSGDDVSVSERIEKFENSLNDGDYDDLNKHFHPDMDSYENYLDATVAATSPLGSNHYDFDFTITSVADSGENKNVVGLFSNDSVDNWDYTALMKEDGDDNWKIFSLTIDNPDSSDFTLAGVSR